MRQPEILALTDGRPVDSTASGEPVQVGLAVEADLGVVLSLDDLGVGEQTGPYEVDEVGLPHAEDRGCRITHVQMARGRGAFDLAPVSAVEGSRAGGPMTPCTSGMATTTPR